MLGELAAEVLRAGCEVKFRAFGSSMIPSIWPGDLLVAEPADSSFPEPGEVALILTDRGLLAHRVVARGEDGLARSIVTRGDALAECDAVFPASAVLGVVVSRNGRRLRPATSARGFYAVVNRIVGRAPIRWFRLKTRAIRLRALRQASGLGAVR
ncbi:MAG TPA: S24/S26 family peptidase [Candidatus Acidoferrales bacterium]|nr:S24/S26 family peptidase [Candidatus Acidoferrales bacterium]